MVPRQSNKNNLVGESISSLKLNFHLVRIHKSLKIAKMKQFWFSSLLICFTAYASCSSTFSHNFEDLYELCEKDQFEYGGFKVNSFRTLQGNLTLPTMGTFALEDLVNYHRLFNETEADQLDAIRSIYHRHLVELYGQHYLNNPAYDYDNLMHQKFTALQAKLTSFKGKGKNVFVADEVIRLQSQKMEAAKNLTKTLNIHKDDVLVPEIIHPQHFDFALSLMKGDYDEDSTMAFKNEKTTDVYKRPLYNFERFVPRRASKLFYDWRKDSGNLLSNIYIPFEQHKSKFVNASRPCVRGDQLPLFFELKGKDYQ